MFSFTSGVEVKVDQSSTLQAHGALSSRLRNALGLSSLAALTIASGPCGSCPGETESCFTRAELSMLREQALDSAAGAAGMAGQPGSGGAGASAASDDRVIVESWNPVGTCPTPVQLNAMERLSGAIDNVPDADALVTDSPAECCYSFPPARCGEGRPFLVDGAPRVAALEGELGEDALLLDDGAFEQALARSFAADGLAEHASVAAFARLTLRLLALAAPAELIESAQLASLDELRHAEICFRHASAHAGRVRAPGALPLQGALEAQSFADFVRENLLEGCIGETLAAVRVGDQARTAENPALAAELAGIAEDEARHAELAFRILRFCREREPEVTARVLREVSAGWQRATEVVTMTADPRWARAGRLTPEAAAALDRQTLQTLLLPLFAELLGNGDISHYPASGKFPATTPGTVMSSSSSSQRRA
jgi:hypothetical protein